MHRKYGALLNNKRKDNNKLKDLNPNKRQIKKQHEIKIFNEVFKVHIFYISFILFFINEQFKLII